MRTLSLALRNLLRNRRRSLTTLMAMVIGAVAILIFGGYSRNITYSLQTGYVLRGGHLQVQRKDYFLYGSGNPAAYGIADYQHVIDVVKRDPVLAPMLTVVTPTISLGGIAGNFAAGVSRTVVGTGVVVEDRNRMRKWNDYDLRIRIGDSPLTGTSDEAVVVGTGVARVLELCGPLEVPNCARKAKAPAKPAGASAPADITALAALESRPAAPSDEARIELLAANVHGAPNVASLRAIKAERQGFKELDDMFVGMHLAQAQRLLYGSEKPQATAVVVQLAHTSQIPAAKARLAELLAGHVAQGRAARSAGFRGAQSVLRPGDRHVRRDLRLHGGADRRDRAVHGRQHHEHGRGGAHRPRSARCARWACAARGSAGCSCAKGCCSG